MPKTGKAQSSINRRLDKQTMIYSQNGILFSSKREQTTDTHNDMDES